MEDAAATGAVATETIPPPTPNLSATEIPPNINPTGGPVFHATSAGPFNSPSPRREREPSKEPGNGRRVGRQPARAPSAIPPNHYPAGLAMNADYREAEQTVLVVDDDANVVELTRLYLERDGYRVVAANDGARGLALARDEQPSLVVLDVMLPSVNGLDVCRTLREESAVPIIMLTARVEEDDRLAGLDLGADDYVTKPFSPRELAARVRAVLRRATQDNSGGEPARLSCGPVELDQQARRVTVGGYELRLTPTEFRLLTLLMRQPGRTFTRDEIIDRALGGDFDGFDRTVDAHVSSLRRKLAAAPGGSGRLIQTVYGSGYRLNYSLEGSCRGK